MDKKPGVAVNETGVLVVGASIPRFTEEQIDFAREDLEAGMAYTKMVMDVKKRFKADGRDFDAEFVAWKEAKDEKENYIYVDMIRPDSGCILANDNEYGIFAGVWRLSGGKPCAGCGDANDCEFRKTRAKAAQTRKARDFGKSKHKTNAEWAAELGVSKRQVGKMRKRGELGV